MALPVKTLDLSDLGAVTLRNGDDDKHHRWGGQVRHGVTGAPVNQLQSILVDMGLLKKADGGFGHQTHVALQRFQWYGKNMEYRLKVGAGAPSSGVITPYSMLTPGVPGLCDKNLASELLAWQAGTFIPTTPLVRLNIQGLSNVDTSDTFEILSYPSAQQNEILVHADFADAIRSTMNDQAKAAKVTLNINQSFRRSDVPPSGAVVTPATKSQHLVGHAVDLNIIDGSTTNTSVMFKNNEETDAADAFVTAVKGKDLRWGGDFHKYDPVHFDDFLDPTSEDYEMTYFFVQHCFHAHHPMLQVT
jgi:hypothetical protein